MAQQTMNRTATSRHDYQPPAFLITQVALTFELDPKATRVTSVMQLQRQHEAASLKLDGQQLLQISQFIAEQKQLPSLLRFGRPSLEQLYLRLNGGRL